MHIVYHCVGGAHSSVTAAAIHLNMLPMDHTPSIHDLLNVPFFDTLEKTDRGKILYRGTDEFGNRIYTVSRQFVPHLVLPAVQDMWKILGQSEKDLMFVDTLPYVNNLMRVGGFSSRRLHWINFGRPTVAKGTLKAYPKFVEIVKEVKKKFH